MKTSQLHGAVVALLALNLWAPPALAQEAVPEKTCSATLGSNTMTFDCGFSVKNYVAGTPVTVRSSFRCTGSCGPVSSFGLGDGSTLPQGSAGRLVGGERSGDSLALTFVFDENRPVNGNEASAHFTMNVLMDDGAGGRKTTSCPVDVRLVR